MATRTQIIQRTLLAGTLGLVTAGVFHRQSIVPRQARERENRARIAELREQIDVATAAVDETQALEKAAQRADTEAQAVLGQRPTGNSVVWFPGQIKEQLAKFELAVSSMRLNTARPVPDLPGSERAYWHVIIPVDLSGQGMTGLLLAVAAIEQADPFVRVLDLVIKADPEEPARSIARMNLSVLVQR